MPAASPVTILPPSQLPSPRQRSRPWAPILLTALVYPAMPTALSQTIENEHLSVTAHNNTLRIQGRQPEPSFLVHAAFPEPVRSVARISSQHPIWGQGQQLQLVQANGWTSTVTIFADSPFVQVTTWARNTTTSPWSTNTLTFLNLDIRCDTALPQLRVLGSGGLRAPAEAEGSYTFCAVADPESRHGVVAGWLTHERGVGAFFPHTETTQAGLQVEARIDFGHLAVAPEQSRPTETLLIGCFADARLGLEAYAEAVARHYRITLPHTPGVYCTWYHAGASDEGKIAANAEYAAKHLEPFGLSVIQIDDQWQRKVPRGFPSDGHFSTTGPVKVFVDSREENYPSGMARTAANIRAQGLVAGLWFMPFAGNYENPYFDQELFARNADGTPFHDRRWSGTCLDLTHPKAQTFVFERAKRLHDWGYRYFKIDGMHTGLATYNIYVNTAYQNQDLSAVRLHDPSMTQAEAYRKGLKILRDAAPDTFILGCNVSQNMLSMGPAFGLIDAMRIGPDNGGAGRGQWGEVTLGAWHGGNLYFLNNRVWHNDPDPVYVRAGNPLPKARWMCSWLAVSGSMHTSSEQYADLPPERLDLLRRCLPSHSLPARPVDYLETDRHRLWLVQDERLSVVGLFNWNENEPDRITMDVGRLGLDRSQTYVAFDYWENRFLGTLKDTLDQTLPPAGCRVLALRPTSDHPQLLSTSRHITQGLIDVLKERWDPATQTLSGRSRVVADDPYELRIALPLGVTWQPIEAVANGESLTAPAPDNNGLRLHFTPSATGLAEWHIRFRATLD